MRGFKSFVDDDVGRSGFFTRVFYCFGVASGEIDLHLVYCLLSCEPSWTIKAAYNYTNIGRMAITLMTRCAFSFFLPLNNNKKIKTRRSSKLNPRPVWRWLTSRHVLSACEYNWIWICWRRQEEWVEEKVAQMFMMFCFLKDGRVRRKTIESGCVECISKGKEVVMGTRDI